MIWSTLEPGISLLTVRRPGQYMTSGKCRHHLAVAAQETLGIYCHHLLADYITLAAAPAAPAAAAGPHGAAGDGAAEAGGSGLGLGAAAALREGAYELYGACSPGEVRT